MGATRTGGFVIGFRRSGAAWQKDLGGLAAWAKANGFGAIDVGRDGDVAAPQVAGAGLRVGSVDLAVWQPMISADAGKRRDAVARNAEYVKACAAAGAKVFFVVMLPEDAALARKENFGYMVESYGELAKTLDAVGGRLAIEGWPGAGALCCTPEGLRALFKACPSPSLGVCFDPSHLLRMRIDPLRFVEEFGGRVWHCHGKDTELLDEAVYEYGIEQPPTFGQPKRFGGMTWRYTIPGHGVMRWGAGLACLQRQGYKGVVSMELEDADFNGTEEGEKLGLTLGRAYLEGC